MDRIETLRELNVGRAKLELFTVYDQYADASYYGKACRYRDVKGEDYVYDRREHLFAGPTVPFGGEYRRQWRDQRGRVQTNDDLDDSYAREFRFIVPNYENYKGEPQRDIYKYSRRDALRLDALYRDQWTYVGIIAEVRVEGKEIGSASVWGLEWDGRGEFKASYSDYMRDTVREALDEAQALRSKLSKPTVPAAP